MKTTIAFLDQRVSSVVSLLIVALCAVLVGWFTVVRAREVILQFEEISNDYGSNVSEITSP